MNSLTKLGAVMAAISPLVAAQTFSACNPMTNTTCAPNPAMCSSFQTDFTKGSMDGWKATAGKPTFGPDGAEFTITKRGEAPTIQTNAYLMFGYVEVVMKAATGTGIISSVVLESDDLDEVDWEFLGGDNGNVQTNYFGKGNTTSFDRMIQYPVQVPHNEFHSYAVNWTKESMVWSIDGKPMRTLTFADAVGGRNFPQTPVNVRLGIWAGGDPDNNQGTIEWAGGKTDYSKAPFTMTVKSVKIVNANPGKEYQWQDQTGSFNSIKTVQGQCNVPAAAAPGGPNSTAPAPAGVFAPGTSNGTASGNSTAGGSGGKAPGAAATTTGLMIAAPTTLSAVPSGIIVDTGKPSIPASANLFPTAASQVNASATASSSSSAFTGAAAKPLDASAWAATSLFGILAGLLAL